MSLKNHQFNWSSCGLSGSSLNDNNFICLNTTPPTQEDYDELMKITNCPYCKLPKTHRNSHFLSTCKLVKKHRYNHKYDLNTDETRSDFKKKQDQRKRTDEADKKDADELLTKAENNKKAWEGWEKADAKKARIAAAEAGGATIVGKGGNNAATEKKRLLLSKQILIHKNLKVSYRI